MTDNRPSPEVLEMIDELNTTTEAQHAEFEDIVIPEGGLGAAEQEAINRVNLSFLLRKFADMPGFSIDKKKSFRIQEKVLAFMRTNEITDINDDRVVSLMTKIIHQSSEMVLDPHAPARLRAKKLQEAKKKKKAAKLARRKNR